MCLPYPCLSVLPVLGLSPDAPRYVWNGMYQLVLPFSQVSPHLRWKPLSKWLQLQLWHGLQPLWILPWDWRVSGAGHGNFRNLLPLAMMFPWCGRACGCPGKSCYKKNDFPVLEWKDCAHFLNAMDHFIPYLFGKTSIVNSMISFQILQPHGWLKNKILITTVEQILNTS